MTPQIASWLSRIVAPIAGIGGLLYYVSAITTDSLAEFFGVGLAAFGVLAALSATCFTQASALKTDEEARAASFAGEKFLHASILLTQALIVRCGESLIPQSIRTHAVVDMVCMLAFLPLYLATASYAAYSFVHGMEELNALLWRRWLGRLEVAKPSPGSDD